MSEQLNYKEKVLNALSKAKTLEDFSYIESKIEITEHINRRTIAGRELTENIWELIHNKRNEVITKLNIQPF